MPAHSNDSGFLKADLVRQFMQLLESWKTGESISIIVAQVDPDGIASAHVSKAIFESRGIACEIYYAGSFGHPQNQLIYNEWELMKTMRPISELPEQGPLGLVDSSRFEDARFGSEVRIDPARFIFRVDHHLDQTTKIKDGFDLIESCGSATTLCTLLARALEVPLDKQLRTLAAVGIHSDTEQLTLSITRNEDIQSFAWLMSEGDQEKLEASFNFRLPPQFADLEREVLSTLEMVDGVRIAHATSLMKEEDGDLLSIIANRQRRNEGAATTVIWGVTGGWVRASIRSYSKELPLTKFIEAIFGKGKGGAKHGSGGARYQLAEPHVPFPDTAELLIKFLSAQYKCRIQQMRGRGGSDRNGKNGKSQA
ncbi:MAG: hypothetical protein QY323_06120 [Patescibacteria group bacterium]|nr:MAG: hypothetical protein QY323_06120 [Patescibacteria group bacterium]